MFRFDPVEYLFHHRLRSNFHTLPLETEHAPSDDHILRANALRKLIHGAVVLHVYRNLLASLAVQDGECRANFDFAILRPRPEESSDDTFLSVSAAKIVVEDGKEGDRVDRYR